MMSILRGQCQVPLDVTLSVPGVSEGTVRLLEPNSSAEIANYPIYKILFCVRGHDGTPESDCFAFTESHYNTEIFRIHVFRCQIREAASSCPVKYQDGGHVCKYEAAAIHRWPEGGAKALFPPSGAPRELLCS
eukprot:XP_011619775.1 PREDICTED: rab GTPase-activating protein 1-like [Takifugu rubripes]